MNMFVIRSMTAEFADCAAKRFLVAYAVLGALVVWQLATSVLHAVTPDVQGVDFGIMCGTLLILAGLALVPYRAGGMLSQPAHQNPHHLDTESPDDRSALSCMQFCKVTFHSWRRIVAPQ